MVWGGKSNVLMETLRLRRMSHVEMLNRFGDVSLELRGGSEPEIQTEELSVFKYHAMPWDCMELYTQ